MVVPEHRLFPTQPGGQSPGRPRCFGGYTPVIIKAHRTLAHKYSNPFFITDALVPLFPVSYCGPLFSIQVYIARRQPRWPVLL